MKMKPLILAGAFLACVTSAEAADAWTCTWPILDASDQGLRSSSAFVRFEIATPDLVQIKGPEKVLPLTGQGTHYRILQNNDHGLIATYAVSGFEHGGKDPFVSPTAEDEVVLVTIPPEANEAA